MEYITIRKMSKYQFFWAKIEKKSTDTFEKINWVDDASAKYLSKAYGADPTHLATVLDRGSKLDDIIKIPLSFLENIELN